MTLLAVMAVVLGCAAIFDDLRRGAISNWINLSAMAGGLLYHTFHSGWAGLGTGSAGIVVGFLIFLALYSLGGMGGGDVKLMAAYGSLLGPLGILTAAVLASIIGGLMAAGALAFRRGRKSIPYGPAIVLGSWLTLLASR